MRAMRLHRPDDIFRRPLRLEEVPEPVPGPGQIRVQVTCCGVCRTDLHIVEGELPPRLQPVIPGHQVVGTVAAVGTDARRFRLGERVGVAWLHRVCGGCEFCGHPEGRENLCRAAEFTGWTVDGGYAEAVVVDEAFAYSLPESIPDESTAPLLCAGTIGYRALRLTGARPGERVGLYGFGGSAHITIQVARHLEMEVFVCSRSEANRALAVRLGAAWAGSADDAPPVKLHAAIVFAPSGPVVLKALEHVERGGTVALAGIYMSPIPAMDYTRHLYDERSLRSVANATRRDAIELLKLSAEIPIRPRTTPFPLEAANEALEALKSGRAAMRWILAGLHLAASLPDHRGGVVIRRS